MPNEFEHRLDMEWLANHPGSNTLRPPEITFPRGPNYLKDPKTTTPGTKMGFAGVKKDQARADIIAYLASLSDAPKPFPAP